MWLSDSVLAYLCKALGSIPTPAKNQTKQKHKVKPLPVVEYITVLTMLQFLTLAKFATVNLNIAKNKSTFPLINKYIY